MENLTVARESKRFHCTFFNVEEVTWLHALRYDLKVVDYIYLSICFWISKSSNLFSCNCLACFLVFWHWPHFLWDSNCRYTYLLISLFQLLNWVQWCLIIHMLSLYASCSNYRECIVINLLILPIICRYPKNAVPPNIDPCILQCLLYSF